MKANILKSARALRLMHRLDEIKFIFQKIKKYNSNKQFVKENPNVSLPPDYLMFESYKLDYQNYYYGGLSSANDVINTLSKYESLKNKNILDWGCGPARILRHLPDILDSSNKFFGTDYNKSSIEWCKKNIKNVHFEINELNPPLKFDSNFFDIVYSISIFTHLSDESHTNWINEIYRVLKPGALFYTTTHGDVFKKIMTQEEIKQFDNNKLVIRGNVKEGHRVYTAFQPPKYFQNLIQNKFKVIEFTPGKIEKWGLNQDLWILQRH